MIILSTQLISLGQSPAFQWAKAIGGVGQEQARDIKTDALGNVFIVGTFEGIVDFDPGSSTYTLSSNGSRDIYVTKFDGNGNFLWAGAFGSATSDIGRSIELDASGNIYVAGAFQGTVDFDPGPAISSYTSNGSNDIFVLKLNSSGNFIWVKQIGGSSSDEAYSIDLDAGNNVYVCGNFISNVDFDPNAGVQNLTASGILHDSFILKLNSSGNYVWAKSFGSNLSDVCNDISIDGLGNVSCIGMFQNTVDFDPGPSTYTLQTNGGWDFFVSKLDASGNFVWAKSIGGTGTDRGDFITSDFAGNVYCTGTFIDVVDFDPGSAVNTLTANGTSNDVYILKLDAGGSLDYVKQIGSNLDENSLGIFLDANNLYVSGGFQGTVDFDSGTASYTASAAGTSYDAFITKTDLSGNFIGLATITGTLNEIARGITLDQASNIFVVGYFQGISDFDPNLTTYTLSSVAQEDAFVLKLSPCFLPIAPINTTPLTNQIICSGSSATLIATSSSTINWYAAPTSTVSLGSGTVFSTPTLAAGYYTYYAEATSCAASATRTPISLTVNASPFVNVVSSSSLLCIGQTANLTAMGAISYIWNSSATGSIIVISPTITTTYTVIGIDINGCSNSYLITQSVTACTGLENKSADFSPSTSKIYPNPNSGRFLIETNKQVNIRIIDLHGKIILEKILNEGQNTIDISDCENGVYFVDFNNGEKSSSFKIIRN